jgi:hypothetical protein
MCIVQGCSDKAVEGVYPNFTIVGYSAGAEKNFTTQQLA